MSKEDFDAYLAAPEKSSDRARSIVYAFIVISIAILFYAMNSFAYPVCQLTFDQVKKLVECRYEPNPEQTTCVHDLGKGFYEHLQHPPQLTKSMEEKLWEHQLTLFYDDSVSLRTFQFPIFGITTDREMIWIIFPFIGILGYYLVWIAWQRVMSLFRHLAQENKSEPTRLRLILSTQMLTSPLNNQTPDFSSFYQYLWRCMAIGVFVIPIIVSLLTMLDYINATAVIRGMPDEKIRFDMINSVRFVVGAVLLAFQVVLLAKLISIGKVLGLDQAFAQLDIDGLKP